MLIAAIGVLASLSVDKSSLLGGIQIFGKGFFDLFDYISSNILLPAGGLLLAIFIGYTADKEDIRRELSNQGALQIDFVINAYFFLIRYITPALLVIVFLNSIGLIKA